MKKFGFIVAPLALALVLFTGCDYIRASLGKPTSADLVKISDELKAREQYLRDSIAAVRAAEAAQAGATDSAAAPQAPTPQAPAKAAPQTPAPQAPAPAAATPLKKYYAVAGAFKNPEGVNKYVQKLQDKGLSTHLFDFKSGLTVICLEGHDTLEEARRDVATLRDLHLSESEPWIYNTNQNLHK